MTPTCGGVADGSRDIDRQIISELRDDAIANHAEIANLREALVASRRIGAAVGIVMAGRRCTEAEAFDLLRTTSHVTNEKLRRVADQVVLTGVLPTG